MTSVIVDSTSPVPVVADNAAAALAVATQSTPRDKKVGALVLDSGGLIKNEIAISTLIAQAEELYTIPAVISELKDEATRARIQPLMPFLKLRNPRPDSSKFISDFARKTGDLSVLSRVDLQLLALTYELEKERNKGDWRLRNDPTQKTLNGRPPGAEEKANNSQNGDADVPGVDQPTADEQVETSAEQVVETYQEGANDGAVQDLTSDGAVQEPTSEEFVQEPVSDGAIEEPTSDVTAQEPTSDGVVQDPTSDTSTLDPTSDDIAAESASDDTAWESVVRGNRKSASVKKRHDVAARVQALSLEPTLPTTDGYSSVPFEQTEESEAVGGNGLEDDGEGEWITPGNLDKHRKRDKGLGAPQPIDKMLQVAILTTDNAMRNVALRINLNLLDPSFSRITYIKTWVLRCHTCMKICKEQRQFCPSCGHPTLTRVSVSTDANNNFTVHLKKNFQWNNRGNVYSIPKPTHGSASGKTSNVKGGGKGGWGQELILAEDQKEYSKKVDEERRTKYRDLMDEDYLPSILTGDRAGGHGKVKVGAGRSVNSKKRR